MLLHGGKAVRTYMRGRVGVPRNGVGWCNEIEIKGTPNTCRKNLKQPGKR